MKILGIDPGTATSGYGVVEIAANTIKPLDYGNIKTDKLHLMPYRLVKIYDSAKYLMEKHKPDVLVIEQLFFNTNVKTAITVGQSRGIFIFAAGQLQIPVFEYTALQAKMALTGYGRAEKEDVMTKVKELLNIFTDIKPIDASDALALTICHAHKIGKINIVHDIEAVKEVQKNKMNGKKSKKKV